MNQARPAAMIFALAFLGACAGVSATDDAKPWSVRPIGRANPPGAPATGRNPIDAFLAVKLDEAGLKAVPEADRRELIRRLTFDLTGMPPTPAEIEAFGGDTRPDAYERLVDRLLASPAYGERWGRFWLDLARYAETHGYERDDPKPGAWRFRDYVIASLNADKGYDRFVIEQLAGDEIPGATAETKIATAIYRLGLIDDEPADPVTDRFDQLDDNIKVVGTTFLGLTIHCARCHDHKFDPIPQADYYRMLAFLTPGKRYVRDSVASISVSLLSRAEENRVAELNRAIDRQIEAKRVRLRDVAKGDANKALRAAIEQEIRLLEGSRPANPQVLGLTDSGTEAEPTPILKRGDAHSPGAAVEPGFLSILGGGSPEIDSGSNGSTTGRRTALARWIARGDNPLTVRVIVNRLWQAHFGRGIVATSSDFGSMGEAPTHPELLDWLASEFVDRGWSWKSLHRVMVGSAAYRRSGRVDPKAIEADSANSLLWRQSPRRLEAEAIRDAALSVSGDLQRAMYGESVRPQIEAAVLASQSRPGSGWTPSESREAAKRSIYVHIKRTLAVPELELMDAPDSSEPCAKRLTTTTAPQALTMLNGAFWHDQALKFAIRLEREAGEDRGARVRRAFSLAYGRLPAPEEEAEAVAFLADYARRLTSRGDPLDAEAARRESLAAFCLMILNSNEFLTVD